MEKKNTKNITIFVVSERYNKQEQSVIEIIFGFID